MKKVLIFLLIIFSIGLTSCEKEEDDLYYIRYKIECSNENSGGVLNVSFKSEDDQKIFLKLDQNTKWEIVIGPVLKGFSAELSIGNRTNTPGLDLYAEIDERKNDTPFTMKVYEANNASSTSHFSSGTYYYTVGD